SCLIKAKIVEKDEKESGLRVILNYGHTIGHVIEALGHYRDYPHGRAVAIGMLVEALIAKERGLIKQEFILEIGQLLKICKLNLQMPQAQAAQILDLIKIDKKAKSGKIRLVLPVAAGKVEVFSDISDEEIINACKIFSSQWP
ncbi:MAG: hypothetical protein OMM_13962, partial [Candidatus Magnetoglobus multicellularis str. Araruama]